MSLPMQREMLSHLSRRDSTRRPFACSPQPRRKRRPVLLWAVILGLSLVLLSTCNVSLAYAASATPLLSLKGAPSTPNRPNPTVGSDSKSRTYTPGKPGSEKAHPSQTIQRNTKMPMKPGSVDLQVEQESRFMSSDKRLELLIPAEAITEQEVQEADGKILLQVTQVAPASGSNAGGSGHFSLGTYLLQLVDAHGSLLTHGLHKTLTATYHLQKSEQGLGLDTTYVLLNGAVSENVTTIEGVVKPPTGKNVQNTVGTQQTQKTRLSVSDQTLMVTAEISTPSTSLSWNGDTPIAYWGAPDPFSTSLSVGALTSNFPIEVPDGPGGFTPSVSLNYNSESVNSQHSYATSAGWVGEGWNLSMGAITWSQHNVLAGCQKTGCGSQWENVWYLSDPYGTNSELIPPAGTVSTYYDATTNVYCEQSNPTYPCPVRWHTANESYAKIYSYVGNVSIPNQTINPPCWRVWLPDGTMEEFGCTNDSLQYFYVPGGHAEVTGWLLDLITDPQGNQIHLTYQRDMASWTDLTTNKTYSYPRDVVLSTIEYDSPTCHNAQSMCTGSAWAPQMQVVFTASHVPNTLMGTIPSNCNTGSNLRCDNPVNVAGGTGAPLIQHTFVLNGIQVQVRTSGTGTWNTLRAYQLGYEQSGPTKITDPASGLAASVAGMLDLIQIQQVGSTGAHAILYSGNDTDASKSYSYMKAFDVSSQNLVIGPNTALSYWIFPQSPTNFSKVTGTNSTCVAVDILFTDGTYLRDSGAVDQAGNRLHPASQCRRLTLDQWNHVTSTIGVAVNGKTIKQIEVGYDQPANTGGYRGWIDDISLTNLMSATPLFATTLETNDPPLTWTNTIDRSSNVGGISGSLTGMELWTAGVFGHTDSAADPVRTFTYTTVTNYYEDSFYKPNPVTNCGPSWNTGAGNGCFLWQQSYANNSRFLASSSNGEGLAQTFTWKLARNNSHGVPGGGSNNADPFYCDSYQTQAPCNEADDSGWSHVVLLQESATTTRLTQQGQGGIQTSTPITETTNYTYHLTYPLPAQECGDCVAGMYWGDQNDANYLNYYDSTFMGFAQAMVTLPTGAVEVHTFYAGEGWGVYDTSKVPCYTQAPCHTDPWWNLANAAHGREYQTQYYDIGGTTLLQQVDTTYVAICPPAGVSGTPDYAGYNFDGQLISELSKNNAIAVCAVHPMQQVTQTSDGTDKTLKTTTNWTYDDYGRVTQTKTAANGGTPDTVVNKVFYVWNDAITATKTSVTGTYILNTQALTTTEDGSGKRLVCSYMSYDGQGYATGQRSSLTRGLTTQTDNYANCGDASNNYTPSGKSTTTSIYDVYGNVTATTDPDANAGISGHVGCAIGSVQYTSCSGLDTTFSVFPTTSTNALNQTSSTNYTNTTALFGYGTWPMSTMDANNQATTAAYDPMGRMTSIKLSNESSAATKQWVYTNWCTGIAGQSPCIELDEIDRIDSDTTTTTRAFYDGEGRLIETRAPGPDGQDVVTYAFYDTSGRQVFKSNPYFVAAYTGTSGPAAYSIPDTSQVGTSTTYSTQTLLQTSVTDPNSHTTTTAQSIVCGVTGISDTGCYAQSQSIDAAGHKQVTLTGGMGNTAYQQVYTGTSTSTYTLYTTTTYQYDALNHHLSTLDPDGSSVATVTYNALGQVTQSKDPDRGASTFTYDPNGNLTKSVDARGSAGTVYIGYDGLNRMLWRNNTNSASGAWVTYTYDSTANGNLGIGKLTSESFTGSGGLSGSYSYTYDGRGQQTGQVISINGTNYTIAATYNDNGQVLTQTYPDGEVVAANYDPSSNWLNGLTTTASGVTTNLATNLQYTGIGGAAGRITTMLLGNNHYRYSVSFDSAVRVTNLQYQNVSTGTTLYQAQPGYDAINNVVTLATTLPGGTDTQQFCYDDLSQIIWSGASGTPPCASLTSGTLTSAQYQQSYHYDVGGRLTSGSIGSYTYGDTDHPHAVTLTSSGYSASYDATGNMICRALTSAKTCSGSSPTGQKLRYDAEGRLSTWQDAPTAITNVNYLYDGEGNRVAMRTVDAGDTTTIAYIGNIEEIKTSTGASAVTTTYYGLGSKRIASAVNGIFYYYGMDVLGSPTLIMDGNGNVVGSQLYDPYGTRRYSNGNLPTSLGFTGQRSDSVTGLDYYMARYYDPVVGRFISPDSEQGNPQGMDPYAYVHGNPETFTDPSGHRFVGVGGGDGNAPPPPPPPDPPSNAGACNSYACYDNGGGYHANPSSGSGHRGNSGGNKGKGDKGSPGKPTKDYYTTIGNYGNFGGQKPPTPDQIDSAKSVASTASGFFGGLATVASLLAAGLRWLSTQLFQWAVAAMATGPWGIALGVVLVALGATAATLAWQAAKLGVMLGTLALMFVGENRMPDSWWTPGAIRTFGDTAGAAVTAAGVFVDFASFFAQIPMKLPPAFSAITGTAIQSGRISGVLLGFMSGEAIAGQLDYYTTLQVNCLTQSSCRTN